MSEDEHIGEVRRWLRYAHEDLVLAEALVGQPGVAARHICWLAQQSVEKALKAALIFLRIDFPRRHDLDVLRDLLPADWSVKRSTPDLADLTEWAGKRQVSVRGEQRVRLPRYPDPRGRSLCEEKDHAVP